MIFLPALLELLPMLAEGGEVAAFLRGGSVAEEASAGKVAASEEVVESPGIVGGPKKEKGKRLKSTRAALANLFGIDLDFVSPPESDQSAEQTKKQTAKSAEGRRSLWKTMADAGGPTKATEAPGGKSLWQTMQASPQPGVAGQAPRIKDFEEFKSEPETADEKKKAAFDKLTETVSKATKTFALLTAAIGLSKTGHDISRQVIDKLLAPLKKLAAISVAVPVAFGAILKGLKEFAGLVSESNRDLAKWNGGLAASFMSLDLKKQQLEINRAAETGGTAANLNAHLGKLLEELAPISNTFSSIVNLGATLGVEIARDMAAIVKYVSLFPGVAAIIKKIEDDLKQKNNGPDPLAQDLRALIGMRLNGDPAQLPDQLNGPRAAIGPRAPLPPILNAPPPPPPARRRR